MALLADRNFRVELAEGTMTFRVLRDSNAQVEISTPTASLRPKRQGTYRITVRDDFSTEITVRSGESDVFVGQDYSPLRSGQTLIVRGDPANPERNFVSFLPRDDWDSWNESRDRDLERSDSYKYVSRDIYGADDLYGHGRWIHDPPYGWVWAPRVAANWAPYRDGRWYHTAHYGWTWVSADPWGWAPYHYGRWYHAPRHGWVWYPGAIGPRHYWRPALVSFIGWGVNIGSVNLSFGFGNVGWVPLAPYEVYRPWYGRHVNVVNVVNNVSVVNVYRNARIVNGRSGVTSVVAGDFGRRRVTVNNYIFANDRDLNRAGDVRGRVPFEPTRDSRRLSDRQGVARNDGRRNNDNRQFVVSRPDISRADNDRLRQPSQPTFQPSQPRQAEPRNNDRENDRVNDRVLAGQPNLPRQDVRPEPRNNEPRNSNDRVNDRVVAGQPSTPRQPAQPDRTNRPDRLTGPERVALSPDRAPVVGVSSRREEARNRPSTFVAAPSRPPEAVAIPSPAAPNNRGLDRRPERNAASLSGAVSAAPRVQRENPQPARREAPAVQNRRPEPQAAQRQGPANANRGQGRGRR
jgi:hypothetical protein